MDLRGAGVPVTYDMLHIEARTVASSFDIDANQFKASRTWAKRFLATHGLTRRTKSRVGQSTPEDGVARREAFSLLVRKRAEELGVDRVYNADQTGVNYEHIPKVTYDEKGAKTIWVRSMGADKDRATAMLLGDSFGNRYPLFIIVKTSKVADPSVLAWNLNEQHGFGSYIWEEAQDLQTMYPIQMYANPTAWWNFDISIEFLKHHFGHGRDYSKPVLLLWDAFSAHSTAAVKKYAEDINVHLMTVPAGYTYVCQPADVGWMQPLKTNMRKSWVQFLRNEIAQCKSFPGRVFARPSRYDVVEWLVAAWDNMPRSTIVNAFVKCQLVESPVALAGRIDEAAHEDYNDVVDDLDRLGIWDGAPVTDRSDRLVD